MSNVSIPACHVIDVFVCGVTLSFGVWVVLSHERVGCLYNVL